MIVLFGQRSDPHVSAVGEVLDQKGCTYSVVDTTCVSGEGIETAFLEGGSIAVGPTRVNLRKVSAIWWRLKPTPMPIGSVSALYDHYFVNREWNQLFDALIGDDLHIFEINNRRSLNYANNKITQLKIASAGGFNVPKTIVSNNSDRVIEFLDSLGRSQCIFKTFTPYMPPSGHITFTTLVDRVAIKEKWAEISQAPGIFQEFIKKKYELRITVVGDAVFAAKINSDHSELSSVDWRRDQFSDIYESYILEEQFKSRLMELHNKFALFYAAYDFIVDTSGRYIFLEVNPAGQWMWLEKKLGFPISQYLADALIVGHHNRCLKGVLR